MDDLQTLKSNYIFVLKNIKHLQLLKNILSTIKNKNPMWIGISHDIPEVHEEIIKSCNTLNTPYNVICNYEVPHDLDRLDNFMKNYTAGWTFVNIVGDEIKYNEEAVHLYSDKNGNPLGLVKEDESINNTCYFNFLYVYLRGNKAEITEEEDEIQKIEFKTYEQKIYEQSPSMVKTWKELNEFYDNFNDK
jgi:hypothetical protein